MNFLPGTRISVKPIVFYPKGVPKSNEWLLRWLGFHIAAREKFELLLKGRDTFELADLRIIDGKFTAAEYQQMCFTLDGLKHPSELGKNEECSNGVETILAEILDTELDENQRYTRYTLPYCLSVLMVDPTRAWGAGGGRNLNGALNLGGGILVIPSWQFADGKLMSTLLHELGHSFGLTHVEQRIHPGNAPVTAGVQSCYYAKECSNSIMSYKEKNQTNATNAASIPGCLIGDEIEALARNKLVFPNLVFDAETDFDCPPGSDCSSNCPPHDGIVRSLYLGPMHMFWCTSSQTAEFSNILGVNDHPGRWILSSTPKVGFHGDRMWHSVKVKNGEWVSLDVTFPLAVTLNRIAVYTQHSGQFHKAEMVQVEREQPDGSFQFVKRVATPDIDTEIEFAAANARTWRLAFQAGDSGHVALRGLRFFVDDVELFPPPGPHAVTQSGETFGSKVSNLVEIQRVIRANSPSAKFDARTMWHSDDVNEAGWVSFTVVFPDDVFPAFPLDRLKLYTQHSGQFHRAKEVQIEVADDKGAFQFLQRTPLIQANTEVTFPLTHAKAWKLAFKGDSHVVVRGLRFFAGNEEFYPPSRVEV